MLLQVTSVHDSLRIHGFTSPPALTRSNRSDINFYVNNRPVQDTALAGALLKAYHTLLMVKRYPISVLFLDLPHEHVDVNVHPTKAEVRFRERGMIFSSVQNAVRKALLAYSQVPGMNLQPQWTDQSVWKQSTSHIDPAWRWSGELSGNRSEVTDIGDLSVTNTGDDQISRQEALSTHRIPLLRPVGQVASAYLVAEGPDGLYLIDQHAAHERILFEKFMDMPEKSAPSQLLLQPASVDFPADQAQIIEEQLDLITKLGFQVEQFGKDSFLIRAIPAILENLEPPQALRIIVEDFEEDETPLKSENEARIVARICKRAAVKAGQSLSPDEQRALISDLEACQSPRTCPHGRPTMIHLSVNLLERQFGRKGAR
jgi:DNA mismatch repair protein MutL